MAEPTVIVPPEHKVPVPDSAPIVITFWRAGSVRDRMEAKNYNHAYILAARVLIMLNEHRTTSPEWTRLGQEVKLSWPYWQEADTVAYFAPA